MNCKNCSALRWNPNNGVYCTVPNCNPDTTIDDVREIYKKAFGEISDIDYKNQINRYITK